MGRDVNRYQQRRVLDNEAQLIQCIQRRKRELAMLNKDHKDQAALRKLGAPKIWPTSDGLSVSVDTPITQRNRELHRVYNALMNKCYDSAERLDILRAVKAVLKEEKCGMTAGLIPEKCVVARELLHLIDREADLVVRGFSQSLDGLRERLGRLFVDYIKLVNHSSPEATVHKTSKPDPIRRLFMCNNCLQYRTIADYELDCGRPVIETCLICDRLRNMAGPRGNSCVYKILLRELRRNEDAYNDGGRIAFITQPKDLEYLVTYVWNAKSVLSANDDLFNLTLPRWNRYEHWAPWNCILLTRQEAASHEKLSSVSEGYEPVFVAEVERRNARARILFRFQLKVLGSMPLACVPDSDMRPKNVFDKRIGRPAKLKPLPCTLSPWPIQIEFNPRKPITAEPHQ